MVAPPGTTALEHPEANELFAEKGSELVDQAELDGAILEQQKRVSQSNYVFVRFGERVNKDLWYTAPVSRHTVSSQFSDRRDEMGLPWDAVLHSTRLTALTDLGAAGANAFTIQGSRWARFSYNVAAIRASCSGNNDAGNDKARCKITSGAARNCGF